MPAFLPINGLLFVIPSELKESRFEIAILLAITQHFGVQARAYASRNDYEKILWQDTRLLPKACHSVFFRAS